MVYVKRKVYKARRRYGSNTRRRNYAKKNWKTAKKGLNQKEKSQVRTIAKVMNIAMSKPKRHVYNGGEFHSNVALYAYGSPVFRDANGLRGAIMNNLTTSIAVGRVPYGSDSVTRQTYEIYVKSINMNLAVSYNPTNLPEQIIIKLALVSTLNDPPNGNLGFLPNVDQNAASHIPSLLLPPGNTMGLRYFNSPENRSLAALDLKEYKMHWQKRFVCQQSDVTNFRVKYVKINEYFKKPLLQKYTAQTETSILGRRYFLLYNSSAENTTATQQNEQAPAIHMRIWTHFRDRLSATYPN